MSAPIDRPAVRFYLKKYRFPATRPFRMGGRVRADGGELSRRSHTGKDTRYP
jgi:hypothetical protein